MRRAAVVLLLLALTACGSEGVETQPTPASGAPADPAAALAAIDWSAQALYGLREARDGEQAPEEHSSVQPLDSLDGVTYYGSAPGVLNGRAVVVVAAGVERLDCFPFAECAYPSTLGDVAFIDVFGLDASGRPELLAVQNDYLGSDRLTVQRWFFRDGALWMCRGDLVGGETTWQEATRMFLLDDPDLDVRVLSGTDASGAAQTVADAPVPETGMVEIPLRR